MKSKPIVLIAFLSLCFSFILMTNDAYAAGETLTSKNYISDISVLSVSDDLLEVSGDKKILPNRIGSSLLSYTTTDSKSGALKNIILSDSGSAPKTKDGADYKKLCSISGMNLYGTYDLAAGDGITGLSLTDTLSLGNGSHIVRDENGKTVSLKNDLYLVTVSEDQPGKYLSELALIKGSSEESAIKKAADSGYDFYRLVGDKNDKVTLIAFNRTNDEKKAIRGIYAVGENNNYELYYSLSEGAGLPVMDIELSEVSELLWSGDMYGIGKRAQASIPLYNDNASLAQAVKSGSFSDAGEIDVVVAHEDESFTPGGDIKLEGVDMDKFSNETNPVEETDSQETEEKSDEEEAENEASDDDAALDEPAKDLPDKSAEEAEGTDENADEADDAEGTDENADEADDAANTTGSLINQGNIAVIVICVVSVIGLLVIAFVLNRKNKKGAGL